MSKDDKKKYTGVSAAVWILLALILLILFLVNRNRILNVLQSTGFFGKVFGSEPEFVVNHEAPEKKEPLAELEIIEQPVIELPPVSQPEKEDAPAAKTEDKPKPEEQVKAPEKTEEKAKPAPEKTEPAVKPAQMSQHLCFISISDDGKILRKEIDRSIDKTNMPLTAAMGALLKGPDASESSKGMVSLIPPGTRLLGASVKDRVATINLSEEFLYNSKGVEGYYGQLMQIVFTATAFSNIESVQFLVEGEKLDYLGSEGVFIGAPLPRSTFK